MHHHLKHCELCKGIAVVPVERRLLKLREELGKACRPRVHAIIGSAGDEGRAEMNRFIVF